MPGTPADDALVEPHDLETPTVTDRPSWAPQGIDLTVPSVSRVYDYFLGGSHNFEVDREAARVALKAFPGIPKIGQANRAAMRRAVRFAVDRGIGQFLDIGSGIPTFGNVHEVAQAAAPGARVVYVDNDPVAVAHSKAVLADNPDATIAAADLRDPLSILEHPETRRMLDFDRPIALMLVAVVHFLSDDDRPAEIIATLRDALAPGSIMVITHATLGGPTPEGQRAAQKVYQRTATPLLMRTKDELEPFFAGFEIVEPGIVPLAYWRPDAPLTEDDETAALHGLAAVGLKA
ncbi:SAM-dependent methyltransferase [Streptomyces sp. PLK6-54]|uniref:SAM-dependent methyltransferase n=1 Tax=Actinacidiphila acidipaludis TaxID=2873382 RepID=A0ABS7QCX0_9ACTN|nr:SAM-dependent methyltransferase [Streptomyces acidipaludis]